MAADLINKTQEFLHDYPKTGPGTAAGNMLRRYWHPVCLSKDLVDLPYPVRMLSEDLVAFRAPDGTVGLVGERCPHRRASLAYGQVGHGGLMCSYHGWTFDKTGHCIDQPLEAADACARVKWRHSWYPTQEWGGVVWCYMGPDKEAPPPLPKIDILARTDGEIVLDRGDIRPYNYLNFLENFADMGHIYVMHMLEPGTVPPELEPYVDRSVDIDWRKIKHHVSETDFGMKCVLVQDTASADLKFVNTWSIALPCFFRFGGISAGLPPDFTNDRRESGGMVRIIDDTHFELFRYALIRPGNFRANFYNFASDKTRGVAAGMRGTREKMDYDFRKYPAWEGRPQVEDYVLQESQGAVPDRENEILGTSDIGVALLRRIWRKSIDNVAKGEQPKPVLTNSEGVVETDTFKGLVPPDQIKLGPENMPSSKHGRGLIRDAQGALVFVEAQVA